MRKAIEAIALGGNTRRFHNVPVLENQTVGHHSYGVAHLAMLIYPGCSKNLLAAALLHDVAEGETGDIPSPVKRALEAAIENGGGLDYLEQEALSDAGLEMPLLCTEEHAILKLADCLDGMLKCIHERRMGNVHPRLSGVYWKFRTYVLELLPTFPVAHKGRATQLSQEVAQMWLDANKEG